MTADSTQPALVGVEQVVLLDADGHATGVADKATVHHGTTPLHLAFSCYVFDGDDRLLLTQRSAAKVTFPGVWTNTVCGHPAPGEPMTDAVCRRARDELGLAISDVRLVLPRFGYVAQMDGVVENELCPVFVARVSGSPDAEPDPDEVGDLRWQPWDELRDAVLAGRTPISPWCADQVRQLTALGATPADWPTASDADLPPAARTQG